LRTIGTRWSGFGTRNWLDLLVGNRRAEFPLYREIWIRLVRAERSRLDTPRESICERGIVLGNSFQYRFDRLADALPRSFRS
jgi:hypothetical protein